MSAFLIAGALGFAVFLAPEQPRALVRFPAHVNEVRGPDDIQVSVEFSVRVQVINAPATKLELIRMAAGKNVMLEVPLWDDLSKSVGERGVRARVVQP